MGTALERAAAKLAHRSIRTHGRSFTYVDAASNTFIDRGTGKAAETPPPSEYSAKGLWTNVRQSWIDGTTIRSTDEAILVAREALDVVPSTSGIVKVGGRELSVVAVRPRYSGELVWGYVLIVRG